MRPFLFTVLLITAVAGSAEGVDHAPWDALLKEHVSEGLVDYAGMARDRAQLDAYLADLGEAEPESLSTPEQVAFWANAYNARMIALVLANSPIRGTDSSHPANSVLQVPGIFKSYPARIGGRELTLDRIEHEILRPRFGEPRIHAAIVCASGSCPELRAEAFTGERLEAQLDDQFRRFVNDERRNSIDLEAGTVRLSKIFDWFAEDFTDAAAEHPTLRRRAGKHAGVLAFIAAYLPEATGRALLAGRLRVSFLPYDWALNDTSAPPTFGR
jgi:hypothetical protein